MEPITYSIMSTWMRKIGEILGLQYSTIPYNLRYNLRYNAANTMDQNRKSRRVEWEVFANSLEAHVSDATRNLALDHASPAPFQRNYLGRAIPLDLWGIMRCQNPQHALMKQSCTTGHSISKRRPVNLTTKQAVSVITHPTIKRLEKKLHGRPPTSNAHQEIRRKIRNEKERLRRDLR